MITNIRIILLIDILQLLVNKYDKSYLFLYVNISPALLADSSFQFEGDWWPFLRTVSSHQLNDFGIVLNREKKAKK